MAVTREERAAARKVFRDAVDAALAVYLAAVEEDRIDLTEDDLAGMPEDQRPAAPIPTVVVDWILIAALGGYDEHGDSWTRYTYTDGHEAMPPHRQKGLLYQLLDLLD